jgi:hypothetical protein
MELGRLFVYYESIKREVKIKPIYECRCDDRLQTKTKRLTRLSYTGVIYYYCFSKAAHTQAEKKNDFFFVFVAYGSILLLAMPMARKVHR